MKIRTNPKLVGWIASRLIKLTCSTLRWEIIDPHAVLKEQSSKPMIWAFWHNQIFCVPYIYQKWFPNNSGCVLTSPSYDGEIISSTMRFFDLRSIRGSSNKRSTESFRECLRAIKTGHDIAITPDGPRGPKEKIKPGLVKLSQLSGCPILPINIKHEKARHLNTWDSFKIPKMFSKVYIHIGKPYQIDREVADLKTEELKVENLLSNGIIKNNQS